MSGEILFLAHRMPFPPNRGDKIRSHHILKRLAELAPVHVATFADDPADLAEEPALAALAASYALVQRCKPLPLAGLEALARGVPVSLAAFADRRLHDYVERVLAERPITAIYVFSGQMGQYVPASFQGRVIADFVDVDSAKFDAYGRDGRAPRAWIDRREGIKLRAVEVRLAQRAAISLLISQPEADLFAERLPAAIRAAADIRVLGNGIDAEAFDPGVVQPEPRVLALPGPRLIFTGQMDYAPNVAAVVHTAERLLPVLRERFAGASFHIVGRNPVAAVQALDRLPGCYVWGGVPDMRTWLAAADLAVVPLELARGVQNKVLEAMAMTLPVILTSHAATGIAASPGRDFAIADDDTGLIAAISDLCANPAAARTMGQAARRYVIEQQSWSAALAPLDDLIAALAGPDTCNAA